MSHELPTADLDFVITNILQCDKILPESRMNIGSNTITFVIKGIKPMHKRFVVINHKNGVINFNQATALAIRFQFMGDLLKWFEENRSWKEGAYIVEEIERETEEE